MEGGAGSDEPAVEHPIAPWATPRTALGEPAIRAFAPLALLATTYQIPLDTVPAFAGT